MDYEAFKALLPTGEQLLTADTLEYLAYLMSDYIDDEGEGAEEQKSMHSLHSLHPSPRLRVAAENNHVRL